MTDVLEIVAQRIKEWVDKRVKDIVAPSSEVLFSKVVTGVYRLTIRTGNRGSTLFFRYNPDYGTFQTSSGIALHSSPSVFTAIYEVADPQFPENMLQDLEEQIIDFVKRTTKD